MGLGYEFAQTEAEFKKLHPGLSTDKFIKTNVVNGLPQVELTADQLAKAKEAVKKQIISQLDNTVTQKLTALGYPPQPTSTTVGQGNKDQLDFGYRIDGQNVYLFEIRPRWDKPEEITETPVAKTTFIKSKNSPK